MKAWVLHGIGDIRLEETACPEPAEQEVLLAVRAMGICGSDIPRIYRTGAYSHPLIPGHEFAGQVVKAGKGVDSSWKGQRVGVFPLIPCGSCGPCQRMLYEMCRNYSYLGSRRNGGFAEYVTVPVQNLLRLPGQVSYEEAAMLEPMAVTVHAMRRAGISASDTVAVCGLGTIGLLLVMFLKEAGISNILAIGNKSFQEQILNKLGISADSYCDSSRQDVSKWMKERTSGAGADVFFECVGKNDTAVLAIENAAPAGKVVMVGNPAGEMTFPKEIYWKILRNQLTVTGTWNSSFTCSPEDDWNYVLDRLIKKRIVPEELISHRFSLQELDQGFRIMRDKTEDYGKIMGI